MKYNDTKQVKDFLTSLFERPGGIVHPTDNFLVETLSEQLNQGERMKKEKQQFYRVEEKCLVCGSEAQFNVYKEAADELMQRSLILSCGHEGSRTCIEIQ
jgi:hypothetical protein